MKEQKFRKLVVWEKAMDFIKEIYRLTEKFPNTEIYGLTNQLRRAATSVALNIAEGSGAGSDKEFKRFIGIALCSTYELMCGIEIAARLNYCPEAEKEGMLKNVDELSAMLTGLKNKLKGEG